jgi:hypothetical protein
MQEINAGCRHHASLLFIFRQFGIFLRIAHSSVVEELEKFSLAQFWILNDSGFSHFLDH